MLSISSVSGPQKVISTASWSHLPPALATLSPPRSGWSSCQEGTFPSRWAPISSRKPSQTWGPSQHQASCLSLSAVGSGTLHTWLRLPGLLGAPGMEGSQAL